MEDILYWVWFSSVPKIGAAKKKKLLDEFITPYNIYCADEIKLKGLKYLTKTNVEVLLDKKIREYAKVHLENIYKNDIRILTIEDDSYPELLKNIYDPPVVLYAKGKIKIDEISIGIVGARSATSYGLNVSYDMANKISQYDITVTSGLAKGIDTCAHKGTLKNKKRTIAVLGCGLDIVYPAENKWLLEEIISCGGLVITEYLPKTRPMPYNFPARNRIISGISRGILVVEAGIKSGSLITADFALEQGREVFAIPGNIGYKNSEGTNTLIKDGAKLVTCVEDIIEEISGINIKPKCERKYSNLNDLEKKIVFCLESKPMHIDLVAKETNLALKDVNAVLIMLELRGIVKQNDGKIFQIM